MPLTRSQRQKVLPPPVQRLLAALPSGTARVVGGAVRDTLLGRNVGDIDLATTLPPEETGPLLSSAGFKIKPTGISHGTITAIADRVGYEITTLRRDIETDGRHAKVAYTDDWQEDAARRDFTMNALYVDADGILYDYVNGEEDARAGRVRFIGDPRQRIREDVLRILRFFRFYAHFGQGPANAEAFSACRDLAPLMPTLSAERVAREFTKLLAAPNPLPALRLMAEAAVMAYVAADATNFARLETLIETETRVGASPTPMARFAALLPSSKEAAIAVAARLKLSKRDAETLAVLSSLPAHVDENRSPAAFRRLLYAHGTDSCRAAALIAGKDAAPLLTLAKEWERPTFPIKGEDLLALGYSPGPAVGETLRALENWWIESNFLPTRADCLAQIKAQK